MPVKLPGVTDKAKANGSGSSRQVLLISVQEASEQSTQRRHDRVGEQRRKDYRQDQRAYRQRPAVPEVVGEVFEQQHRRIHRDQSDYGHLPSRRWSYRLSRQVEPGLQAGGGQPWVRLNGDTGKRL